LLTFLNLVTLLVLIAAAEV